MIFIFPGQGSQYTGMGKTLEQNFKVAKLLFEEINEALSFNLSKIIFNGPTEQLNNTKYTQPAIMAVSMAVVKILEEELDRKISKLANYVMGHSLGEYSALCAAEALSVSDTAVILHARGQAMQSAMPIGKGTMVALLGTSIEQAQTIVEAVDSCEIANDNGGGQVVLSCLVAKLNEIKECAKAMKVKRVMPLPVSAPFHSSFMKPAALRMKGILGNIKINKPSIKFISNATANTIENINTIKEGLITQITNKVRWRESVLYCNEKQASHYVELGPKNVLTNLIKKINPSNTTMNIETTQDINDFIKAFI